MNRFKQYLSRVSVPLLIGIVLVVVSLTPSRALAQVGDTLDLTPQQESDTLDIGSQTEGGSLLEGLEFKTGRQVITTNIAGSVTELNFFQEDIGVFVTRLVEVALIAGSLLVLIYLLWGGIDWISSGGDKAKYEGARNKITAALLGLAIMASAWAVWLLVNYFLGIDKVIQTGSTGGRPGTTTSATTDDRCWPFPSCEAWQAQFEQEHGYQPTVGSGQDWTDFQASQDFLLEHGRSPSQEDWDCRYRNNYEWCD